MPKAPNAISRVEFFCDDKRVGEALRSLVNIAIGAPSVQPVTNAKRKGNGLAAESSGRWIDRFEAHLREQKPKEFDRKFVDDFVQAQGAQQHVGGYVIKLALSNKLIKRKPGTKLKGMKYLPTLGAAK